MNAQTRWQDILAQNMAGGSITGFKKQELSFESVRAGLMGTDPRNGHFLLPKVEAITSFQQGELKPTQSPTDFAISGGAFFEIQMPDGSLAYTRDGEFRLDSERRLVTKQGNLVMGENGPIQLQSTNPEPLSVAADGEARQGNATIGRLKLVAFNNPNLLERSGGSYYIANHPALVRLDSDGSTVAQGFLEGSNASPITEMAGMLTMMRGFETNQRLIQIQDERMTRAIAELGNPH